MLNDPRKLPPIYIDSLQSVKPLKLQDIAFDALRNVNTTGRVGSRGRFELSKGSSCSERRVVATDIPIESAFARFLFFPFNLVNHASVDIEMTTTPVTAKSDGTMDFLYDAKFVLKNFKIDAEEKIDLETLKKTGLKGATATVLQQYMKSQETRQLPIQFDVVMNEKDHKRERFAAALANAFITRGTS
jgi:hypothetical protein